MNKLQVILLSMLAAMAYGILHDQITARICLEYFTVAHPPLFHTRSATQLAIYWGAAATAGIGLGFGAVLALVSQSAGRPPAPLIPLCRKILALLAVMGLSALCAGYAGFYLSRRGIIRIPSALADAIPDFRHDRFMAVWFAHMASYLAGFAGSAGLIFQVWQARGKPLVLAVYPRHPLEILRTVLIAAVVALIVWWRFFALR